MLRRSMCFFDFERRCAGTRSSNCRRGGSRKMEYGQEAGQEGLWLKTDARKIGRRVN